MKERHIFIKVIEGEKVVSFIHLPFTKDYQKIILKWLKKEKTHKPPSVLDNKQEDKNA